MSYDLYIVTSLPDRNSRDCAHSTFLTHKASSNLDKSDNRSLAPQDCESSSALVEDHLLDTNPACYWLLVWTRTHCWSLTGSFGFAAILHQDRRGGKQRDYHLRSKTCSRYFRTNHQKTVSRVRTARKRVFRRDHVHEEVVVPAVRRMCLARVVTSLPDREHQLNLLVCFSCSGKRYLTSMASI